ncbi:MAG TPA: gliding motility-associated C-terminal domain-containing protein [Fulvivirga sp.]|nr:gliding motility-associated C-terminal domain-containing protein [Fulvivirga sp.]
MYWGETNIVEVAVDPCKASYIDGGSIAFTGPYNPSGSNIINNTTLPSSPFASLGFEYVWLQSEVNTPNVVGNTNWSLVTGSENLTELSVSGLTQTMYYIRCARVVGCDMYWGETNIVEVAVDPCKASYIDGGSIAFTGPYNPSGSNIITNTNLPSSPFASLGFEYVWLQSEVNTPNVVGNTNWSLVSGSENLTELAVSGLTQTMYYIRCARVAGCDMYWGETNIVEVAVDPCKASYIDGGSIAFTGPYNPSGSNIINNTTLPSSPFASLGFEYVWLQSEVNTPNVVGNTNWSLVTGSENLTELSVSGLTQTMYYIRCARVVGCDMYWGETNIVEVAVDPCKASYIDGGSIAFTGPYNPSGSNIITNTNLPSSPFASLGFEYVWLQSEVNTPNVVGNTNWSLVAGSENLTELSVSGLTQTMYYIRCARVVGCDMYWGETNIVEVAVDPCKASYIDGGSIAFTGPYNPSGSNIITNTNLPSSPFASLGFEYVWLQSDVNTPNVVGNTNWSLVSGSENLTELAVSGLTQTMYYIRCARVAGCDMYWGETNIVEVEVFDIPTATISGGGQVCGSSTIPINIVLTGAAPFDLTYTNGTENTTIVVDDTNYSFEASAGTYSLISVHDIHYQGTVSGEAIVTSSEAPTATLSGNEIVCGQGTVPLEIALTGSGPFNLTYSNGIANTEVVVNGNTYTFDAPVGTYSLVSVSDANCQGTVEGQATVTPAVLPTATLSGNQVVCGQGTMPLEIALTGSGPFNLTYSNGIENTEVVVNGNTYTFDAPVGTYSLVSVSDANCQGTVEGQAIVTPAVLPTATLSGNQVVCGQGTVPLEISLTGSGPFNLTYSNGIDNTEVVVNGNTYTFEATAGSYSLVSVSDVNCNGTVSGQAIVGVHDQPIATISGNTEICAGQLGSFNISLTGTGPWDVQYTDGSNTTSLYLVDNSNTIEAPSGTYTLLSVNDANCNGAVQGSATITTGASPTAFISTDEVVCEGEPALISIALTGNGPWNVEYTDGVNTTQVTSASNLYTFEATAGTFELLSVSDQLCTGTVSGTATITTIEKPTAVISGGGIVCGKNRATIRIDLTGQAPWTVVYQIGNSQVSTTTSNPSITFTSGTKGDYTIASVMDANCNGTGTGVATIEGYPTPVGQIYLDANNCVGTEVVLNNNFEEGNNFFNWVTNGSGNLMNANSRIAKYVAVEPENDVQFTLSVFNGCSNYEFRVSTNFVGVSAAFTIIPEPTDGNLISNVDYTFSATDLNATSYSWDFGDGNGSSNNTETYAYPNIGSYQISLTATNRICTDTQFRNVAVIDNQNLFVPNVFSPNSSNPENNVLKVYGEDLSPEGFEFYVYNRWGQPVYHTSNLTKALTEGWNGLTNNNEKENNVFTYTLRGKFNNGKSFEKTGTVTLVK